MRELMSQAEIDENPVKWLDWRQECITASDAGAVAAIPGCGSAIDVFTRKIYGYSRQDNLQMRIGRYWEPLVAELFAEDHPHLRVLPAGFYCHDEIDWMAGTFDRWLRPAYAPHGELQLMEVKTTTKPHLLGEPPFGTLPFSWIVQDAWYLAIAGARRLHQAVLPLPYGPPQWFIVDWDSSLAADVADMLARARAFREDHLLRGIPPPADTSEEAGRAIRRIWRGVEDREVTVTNQLADRITSAHAAVEAAAEREQRWKNLLLEKMGDARAAVDPQGRLLATRTASWPRKLNKDRLALLAGRKAVERATDQRADDDPVITLRIKQTRDGRREDKQ